MTAPIRKLVRYSGHVQGVGFRMTAVAQSRGLSVSGFVRNEPDGSVLMDVEGGSADVSELMRRITTAMEDRIEGVDVDDRPPHGKASGFGIEY